MLTSKNNTISRLWPNCCIHELFEEQVKRTPYAIALIQNHKKITYQELNTQVNRMANYLRQVGVKPETLVAVCFERSVEMIVAVLAILKAGGYYLPLDPTYPKSRLEYMLFDSHPKVLLTESKMAASLNINKLAAKVVFIDLDWELIAKQSVDDLPRCSSGNNLAYLIYTSGSTGIPKGVMIEHRSLVNLCVATINAYSLSEKDRILQFAALSFDTSVEEIYPSLVCGATLVLSTKNFRLSISAFLLECAKYSLTVLNLPTAFWHELTLQLEYQKRSLPDSLRLVIIGGESALPERVATWMQHVSPKILLVNTYGCTEVTAVSTLAFLESAHELQVISVGNPIANVQAYILDESLNLVQKGIVGELFIGGVGLARGYLNHPKLNKQKFINNPFSSQEGSRLYRTGDLARYREDGGIEIIGRIDHQVKIRGFRIELGEIETLIRARPNIRDVVAIVREDTKGDKRLVVYFTTHDNQPSDINKLRLYLQDKLPDYMIPAFFVHLSQLPLTPNKKIDRHSLPPPDLYNLGLSQSIVSARNEIESQLTNIWEKVLKIKPIGVKEDFFDLGGDSLLAIELSLCIEKYLGANSSVPVIFEYPTIEKMALAIQSGKNLTTPLTSIVSLQQGSTSNTPLFFIHPVSGETFVYMNIVRYLDPKQPVYGIRSADPSLTRIEAMAKIYIGLIQEIQQTGPYMICGYSMGGYVAFEIAKQLANKGETTSLLVLIDTTSPLDYPDAVFSSFHEDISDTEEILREVLKGFANPGLTDQQIKDFFQMDFENQLAYVLDQMKDTNRAAPDAEISWLKELIGNIYRNQNAIRHYKPDQYVGEIRLITTTDDVEGVEEKYDWDRFLVGKLIHYKLPGNHFTIIQEPNVKILAEKINSFLTINKK